MSHLTYIMFNLHFSIDVRHIIHSCTKHSPSSERRQIMMLFFRRKLLFARTTVHAFSATDRHVCIAVAAFCTTHQLPRSYPSSNRDSNSTVGSLRGVWETVHIEVRATTQAKKRHTLTQNLKAMN